KILDLLTRCDTPQLIQDVLRKLGTLLRADQVALYAGYSPPLLLAAHGRGALAEHRDFVDRRLTAAMTNYTIQEVNPDEPWHVDARLTIRSGVWVPSPPGDTAPAVIRILRVRPEPFPVGTGHLLRIVARRMATVLGRLQAQ